jgi:tRNA 2-selenouridine synthase
MVELSMTECKIDITGFLNKISSVPIIDVRSPAEFTRGHISGAVNLPLFTNEERSIVGRLYLRQGSNEAMMKGLELIGPKIKHFAEEGLKLAIGGEVILHCWRGGMRSNSMAWLFNTVGIKANTLTGGYKAYRHAAHEYFSRPFNLVVIGGMTGSGKTDVLEELEKTGCQIIHLERLASHKGSVFGSIGMTTQPTTEQFENYLFSELWKLNQDKAVFVEDESLAIGRIFIPRSFYSQMSSGYLVHLIVPVQQRIKRLVEEYTHGELELLIDGVKRLEKRLGSENATLIINYIQKGELNKSVEIILRYYDKIYNRSMGMHNRRDHIEVPVGKENSKILAKRILSLITNKWQITI